MRGGGLVRRIEEIARSVLRHDAVLISTRSEVPPSNVICLQMEDHYLRVHHDAGSRLELMPLREAIRRYGRRDGLQVHRSWWVAMPLPLMGQSTTPEIGGYGFAKGSSCRSPVTASAMLVPAVGPATAMAKVGVDA
jgi:hypothetical protein